MPDAVAAAAADQPRLWAIWHTDPADGSTRIAGFCGLRSQAVSIARAFWHMGCVGVQVNEWVYGAISSAEQSKMKINSWPVDEKFTCNQCGQFARINPDDHGEWGCAQCNGSTHSIALNFTIRNVLNAADKVAGKFQAGSGV